MVFAQWNRLSGSLQELFQVYANARRAGSHSRGTIGTFGLTIGLPVTKTAHSFLDFSANWIDSRHARAYYGVTAAQALRYRRIPLTCLDRGWPQPQFQPASTTISADSGNSSEALVKMHFAGDVDRSPVVGKSSLPTILLVLTRHY